MTWASMLRALSQRASQKPSRPASKATAMRSILRPAFSASSRHRCSSFSNALSSTASFFNGWRSTPGKMPATSQLDTLISITAISVPFGSRAMRDRLKSFNVCMERSIGSYQQRWMQYPRRRPIASSITGVEDEVEQSFGRPVRQMAGPSDQTNSPHPSSREGHIPPLGGARGSPIVIDPVRPSCRYDLSGPTELGAVNPDAVHDHGQPTRQRYNRLFHPALPSDLHRPGLEPGPLVSAGQHDLGCFVKHHPHHLVPAL